MKSTNNNYSLNYKFKNIYISIKNQEANKKKKQMHKATSTYKREEEKL